MTLASPVKKGGPYSKQDQKTRRNEVFRLYLEYGYSARKIADMMNINRNTINLDIQYCFSQLRDQDEGLLYEDLINKTIYRLEAQRSRLLERLEKTEEFREIISIEKMIFEIESKQIQIETKLEESTLFERRKLFGMANTMLEKNGYKDRFFHLGDTITVSKETKDKISSLLNEDRIRK